MYFIEVFFNFINIEKIMKEKLKWAFSKEMTKAKDLYSRKEYRSCFYHLERAHILGQLNVTTHTLSHFWMLKVGLRTRDVKEVIGQLVRLPLGIIGSLVGVVPTGNTGGSNVSAIKSMDISDELQKILDSN